MGIINNFNYFWDKATDRLEEYNDQLNKISDRFSEQKALPAIKSAYEKARGYVPSLYGHFYPDSDLPKRMEANWYDPFSNSFILKITRVVEKLSLWVATMKPVSETTPQLPGYFHYLDTCLISGAQHLHKTIKEANFLIELPEALRYYTETLSFDRFISKLPNFFGRSWSVVSKVIIGFKYICLKIAQIVLKVLEVVLSLFGLDGLYYLIMQLKEVIRAGLRDLSSKFTETAHRTINRREEKVRKELTVSIANVVSETVVTTVNRVALKAVVGGALFFGAKWALQSCFNIPSEPLYHIGLGILGTVIWKKVLKPTWDPYYKAYDKDYDPNKSHLKEFCQKYNIAHLYPPLKTLQTYARET